jgi:hypothetical protein
MREFAEAARAAKKAGTAVDAFAKSYTIPAKFQGYAAPEASVRAAAQVIYDEIK